MGQAEQGKRVDPVEPPRQGIRNIIDAVLVCWHGLRICLPPPSWLGSLELSRASGQEAHASASHSSLVEIKHAIRTLPEFDAINDLARRGRGRGAKQIIDTDRAHRPEFGFIADAPRDN